MSPCHPQDKFMFLSMEYKSLHYLVTAFPNLVLCALATSSHIIFHLCSAWNSLSLHPNLPYFITLSSGINSWKLLHYILLPLWPPSWIRHFSFMLISTTPFTVVFIIVWLSIFFLHLTVSFLRARVTSYFSYSFSQSLYKEQSRRHSRRVINAQWMNNRLPIKWKVYEEMVDAIPQPNLVYQKWKHQLWLNTQAAWKTKKQPLRVAASTPHQPSSYCSWSNSIYSQIHDDHWYHYLPLLNHFRFPLSSAPSSLKDLLFSGHGCCILFIYHQNWAREYPKTQKVPLGSKHRSPCPYCISAVLLLDQGQILCWDGGPLAHEIRNAQPVAIA